MVMFYIEFQGDKITGKGNIGVELDNLNANQMKITEDIYNQLENLPCTFDILPDGTISNIIHVFDLENLRESKLTELVNARDNELLTFQSNALGEMHTYKRDSEAITLFQRLRGKIYSQPDSTIVPWFTLEEGWVPHTKAQLIQLETDEDLTYFQVFSVKFSTLDAQRLLAQSVDDLNEITWE
jgi:hypothetical protein